MSVSTDEHLASSFLTSPTRGRGSSTHRVCLSVCRCSSGRSGYLTSRTKVSTKSARRNEQNRSRNLATMFSSRVMTVFSSPRKLYLVVMLQNRHQRVTSAVTRLLARHACRLAIPTTATQAAQTELASAS